MPRIGIGGSGASGPRLAPVNAPQPYVFPVAPHSSGRYFVDSAGTPWPLFGDSMWWGTQNLSVSDQVAYVAQRAGLGFTTFLCNPFEHVGCLNKPPRDFAGNLPFLLRLDGGAYTGSPNGCVGLSGTGYPNGTSGNQFAADPYAGSGANAIGNASPDFTTPSAVYWEAVKAFVRLLSDRGLACVMFVSYVGFAAGDQGWMNEMVANDAATGAGGQAGQPYADGTKSKAWNFGAWLAYYFRDHRNILWINGGDYGSGGASGTFTTGQKTAVSNVLAGMRSVAGQRSPYHGAHWSRPALANAVTLAAGSLDLMTTYTDNTPAAEAASGYAQAPAQPVFQIEGRYEGDSPAGSAPFRKYNWWLMTAGACGYFYGNNLVYNGNSAGGMYLFLSGWQTGLTSQTALDMSVMHQLLGSVAWWKLAPSTSLVTAGGSSSGNQDFVSAALAGDGSLALLYVPPAWASGTFTVNLSLMAGSATAWWCDPVSGQRTRVGTGLAGSHVFTPPASNSGGDTDQVLLLTSP